MIRWLEANGYDVSYISCVDTARRGQLLLNHKVYFSVGHDECWSGEMWAAVENAHLGNLVGPELLAGGRPGKALRGRALHPNLAVDGFQILGLRAERRRDCLEQLHQRVRARHAR